jgi:GAF domain
VAAGERLKSELGAALAGAGGPLSAADRLCRACVELLGVDGAAVSLMHEGSSQGTFGSSGELSRRLDEFQFTFGEGPCLDAVRWGRPVLVGDFEAAEGQRWPAFGRAVLDAGVRAVYALPVMISRAPIGALDLFSIRPGSMSDERLDGGLWAAELAALPLLDLMSSDVDWQAAVEDGDGDGWEQLGSLQRVEVYQATGMIVGELDVDPAEALVRLRAYAFARGLTASEAAWAIVERRVVLGDEESFRAPAGDGGDRGSGGGGGS